MKLLESKPAPAVRIDECFRCHLKLPLRSPLAEEVGTSWLCAECGARFQAVLLADSPDELKRNVRLAGFDDNPRGLPMPPNEMEAFIATLSRNPDIARRYAPRQLTALGTAAVPLDNNFVREGTGFRSLIHAIGTDGAALLHVDRITSRYLALRIHPDSSQPTQVLMQVRLCTALGPFYEIDGPFVAKMGV